MQARYGNILFPPNWLGISRSCRPYKETETGIPLIWKWTYNCELFLITTQTTATFAQADLDNQEQIIRNGVGVPNQPFLLFRDDGRLTDMSLYPQNCLHGPYVEMYENPVAGGAEYATRRTIRFSVNALVAAPGSAGVYLSFEESVRSTGTGGPKNEDFATIDGIAVRQQLYPVSRCAAVQSGSLVCLGVQPTASSIPQPLWPGDEREDERNIDIKSPKLYYNGYIQYPISWSYMFIRIGQPFLGIPNRQI